jgi:hypothetical protein
VRGDAEGYIARVVTQSISSLTLLKIMRDDRQEANATNRINAHTLWWHQQQMQICRHAAHPNDCLWLPCLPILHNPACSNNGAVAPQLRNSLHTVTLVWLPNTLVGLVAKPLGHGVHSVWNRIPREYVSLPHAAIVGLVALGTYLYPGGLAAVTNTQQQTITDGSESSGARGITNREMLQEGRRL